MTRIPVFLTVLLSFACVRPAHAQDSKAAHHRPASHDDEDADCDHAELSFAWAVIREDGNSMSASMEDLNEALRLRKTIAPPYLWVRDGDERYVVTDEKVLDKIEDLEIPQRKLGAKQAKLGAKQAELGRKQARLGMEQARAAMQRLRHAADGDEDDDRDGETRLRELSDEQRELGEMQGRLGREQGSLGREQGRLGRKLEQQIRELYQEAKKSGAARRVD